MFSLGRVFAVSFLEKLKDGLQQGFILYALKGKDWNCCGATAAHSMSKQLSLALPTRVLALALIS